MKSGRRRPDANIGPENNYESTFLDAPETPAQQFAMNAFKHAIFGTPAAHDANKGSKKDNKNAKPDLKSAKAINLPQPDQDEPPLSPSKQPGGVLRTPGTASKGRKTVSFGSHVVDNEGKRGNTGKSGIPNDCPGKFPSPWTPGTELKLDPGSDKRPRTKLTEALLDARTTKQPTPGQKPKARDDSDITIDLGAPRSESGRYWKEQYESYAEKSEREMKKVIAKQQLAKKFAMKKDGEVTELATKLEQERRKSRQRERDLEQQNGEFQERLRKAMAENASATIEVAALKARIAVLEKSTTMATSEVLQSKPGFQIYEDTSKDVVQFETLAEKNEDVSFAPSISMASSGKENSSPKARRHHRLTLPEASARPSAPARLGTAEGEASIILGRSPRPKAHAVETAPKTNSNAILAEQPQKSGLSTNTSRPESPAAVLPSSPLPMPSPGLEGLDPWMDLNNESSIRPVDKLAMPNFAGEPYSRPEWNPPPKQQRTPKTSTHAKQTSSRTADRGEPGKNADSGHSKSDEKDRRVEVPLMLKPDAQRKTSSHHSPTDPKFDLSKITAHHAEGSAQVKKDRAEVGPVDRKAEAKKRLEARRKLRKNAPA